MIQRKTINHLIDIGHIDDDFLFKRVEHDNLLMLYEMLGYCSIFCGWWLSNRLIQALHWLMILPALPQTDQKKIRNYPKTCGILDLICPKPRLLLALIDNDTNNRHKH